METLNTSFHDKLREMSDSIINPINSNALLAWAERLPWAVKMASTEQDSYYHQEGDVWLHTKMVCRALEGDPEWFELDRRTRTTLYWAAVLHDVGKPATTKEEDGRIVSPKHAKVGEKIARNILREIGIEFNQREQVCALIRQHTKPPHAWDKDIDIEDQIVNLSWQCNIGLLHSLVKADLRGRKCDDSRNLLDNLRLWRMYTKEMLENDEPFAFANNHSRFLWFRNELSHRVYAAFEKYRCTVTMLSGLPGSGKDTWAQNNFDGPIVSLDRFRREGAGNQSIQLAKEEAKDYLRKRQNFCFNATNLTQSLRNKWISTFASYGAKVKIVYIEPELSILFNQNENREFSVPRNAMEKMLASLEVPTLAECHEIEYITGNKK